ncbi:hypothetical protein ZTR_10244 [Talaromyces verruculosus]|nr:hypothetical protein ZTR_10244 [Talaromyces verruculosus]
MSYGENYGQGRDQYGDNNYGQGQGQGQREEYGDQQYRGNYGANAPDFSDVVSHAENHGGSSSSFFSQAANYLQQQHGNLSNQDIDQEHMVNSHQKFYGGGGGNDGPASSNELGAGAAMQALKAFTSGGSGRGQNQLIGLAMAEAEKLFDQQSANGNASGDKQSAINSAAEMAFKMYMKGQGGLGGTGGPSGLLSLASKFF